MYILSVNVIYSLFEDKLHTTYKYRQRKKVLPVYVQGNVFNIFDPSVNLAILSKRYKSNQKLKYL